MNTELWVRNPNRRQFLGTVTTVSVGALLPNSWVAAEAPSTWRMRLSASSIAFRKLPLEDACQRIASLGFEGLDVWSGYAGCPHLDDLLKRVGPERFKEVLSQNHLQLNAFSVYVGGYERYAELLAQCGGGIAIQGSAGPCKPAELTSAMKAFFETLKPLLDHCEERRSWLAIENHGNALLDSIDSLKAFVDLQPHPRLGIALAPYHIQAGSASVEAAIEACGQRLLFFYAWQQAPQMEQLPGHGKADFVPWLRALAKIGYRGYVNPFMHEEPEPDVMSRALARSRDYLKEGYAKK
jgi:sugar phosphate isomerase/epimerase